MQISDPIEQVKTAGWKLELRDRTKDDLSMYDMCYQLCTRFTNYIICFLKKDMNVLPFKI
ncbi:hypothetical protein VL01_04665 [Aeromonas enteropelogenes]|nr:hypothetical protein VL01_04665 [Aeromonas enteropelogenes]